MGKYKSPINADQSLARYRMRTPFADPHDYSRYLNDANNQASLNSSRLVRGYRNPNDPFYQTEGRVDKNNRNPNDPFYQTEGRVDKNNQKRSKAQPGSNANNVNAVPAANAKKGCCTIL